MTNDPHASRLDQITDQALEPLRQPDVDQRQRVIDAFSQLPPAQIVAPRRHWTRAVMWAASAACIAGAIAAIPLLLPMSAQTVYGIEAVPARLLAVQTVRQRGWYRIYDPKRPQQAPVQVPVETLIKRPNQFRFNWRGVSHHKDGLEVRTGAQICDGRHLMATYDPDRTCRVSAMHPLEARLMTEMFAQGQLMATLLGPIDASYRKTGEEIVAGRKCDVYEGRFQDDDLPTIARIWFDPAVGLPVMRAEDEVLPDGTLRRVSQMDDIAVDVPLDDALFQPTVPEGYRLATPAAAPEKPAEFQMHYVGAGYSGEEKLECWHALRISDSAALLLWKRNPPEAQADGTRDWLSDMTIEVDSEKPLRHAWVYQSNSADEWNWSLVAVPSGSLGQRDDVLLTLKRKRSEHSVGMLPLIFADEELQQILTAARLKSPADAPNPSLDDLREQAKKLTEAGQ